MFELKPLQRNAIPKALEKAERYRLLNEPWQAESICRDVLAADPENQQAHVTLLLALTDQFGSGRVAQSQAQALAVRLTSEYERLYYSGMIHERWAKASLETNAPGPVVYEWFVEAMRLYEEAARLSPPESDDAVLRWNACVRQIQLHRHLRPQDGDGADEGFGDHAPPHERY